MNVPSFEFYDTLINVLEADLSNPYVHKKEFRALALKWVERLKQEQIDYESGIDALAAEWEKK